MRRLFALLACSSIVLGGCDSGSVVITGDGGPADAGADSGSGDGGSGPVCSDGVVDDGEACDDANNDSGDGCSAACEVERGFECTGEPSACAAVCGDGVVAGMEGCDDANTSAGDGCSDACAVEAGYACTGEPSACDTVCGDGTLTEDEACDDGNSAALDGCSDACEVERGFDCTGEPSVCTATCGDGVIAATEECDTGSTGVDDGCSDGCTIEHGFSCAGEPSTCMTGCGDGLVAGTEACDDGNMAAGDGCSTSCAVERGYACTGEPSACTTVCGDGIVAGAEECDDGVGGSGDGCSDTCAIEAGYTCTGEPSACTARCGDGVVAATEECDDGGIAQGDGCDHVCTIEFGFTCTGSPSVCTLSERVAEVALGDDGGCVRTFGGAVACFGDNTQSEVGNGTTNVETFLPAFTGITDATAITAGEEHHCALRAGGTVWCWGDNSNLQQGVTPTTADQPVPQQIAGLAGIVAIDAGSDHNCVIDGTGAVLCWGDNDNRQLGRGGTSTTDSETPASVALPAGRTAIALALGADHTCALLDDRTVACWGDDDNGQLGDGAAGADSGDPTVVPGLTDVAEIAAGLDNTCARTTAGAVFCWGDNVDGAVGDGTTVDRASPTAVTLPAAAVDIAAGFEFACALLASGEVWCWGESNDYQTGNGSIVPQPSPVLVRGLAGLTLRAIEAGGRGACALTTSDERYCWGWSEEGQLGIAPINQLSLTEPLAFAGGAPAQLALSQSEYRGQACGVFPSGTPECMGTGNTVSTSTTTGAVGVFPGFGEHLAVPTPIPAFAGIIDGGLGNDFACGRTATFVACVGDNSQLQLGQGGTATTDSAVPLPVMGLGAVDELEVGGQFACVRTGGTVQCWGDNDNFQSGVAVTTDQSLPVTIGGLFDAIDIELGDNFGCALRAGGAVACWGDNASGQLGTGTAGTDSATAVAVVGLPTAASQIVVGQQHACALTGGQVWCWGDNAYGQLAQGTTTDSASPVLALGSATAIASGYNYACALRAGGTVTCWGYGLDGHLGNGGQDLTGEDRFLSPVDWIGASGVTEIAAGNSMTCLRTALGWQCAGFRGYGQLGNGTTLWPTRAVRAMTL